MTLHIEITGQGPNLILLHGWAMHSGIFAPLLPSLEQYFRVHSVDLPGHGQSLHSDLALDYDAVWNELNQRIKTPSYIMGWSLGGLFALHGALHFPARCLGLIMQNASPCFVHRNDWPHGMPASVFSQFANDLQQDYTQTLHRFFMLEAQGSDHLRDDLRLLQKTAFSYGEPDTRILCEGLHLLEKTDLRAALATLNTPNLWLAGKRDRLVSPDAMQSASQLSNGQFQLLLHGGHAPFLTEPETITQHIVNFSQTP